MAAKVQNGSYVKIHGKCRLRKQGSHGAGNVRGSGRKAKAGYLDHDSVTCFSGYRLSPQALNIIVKRYATNARISFDDFVACCVRLKALTDQFRRRDTAQNGMAAFQYDDFIQVSMYC